MWLKELMLELEWKRQPQKAYLALRTVLHTLRDRLTAEEAIQLAAQLPVLIRGSYYEGWKLKRKPVKERHKEEFLEHVKTAFKDDVTVDPERVTRAVLRVLDRRTSAGEIKDVKHMLPKSLRKLWP
jgi:uncharacterized protein (DUF2267 family)